ncbi:hypothetical protein VP01_1356g1 [Puccinia sorghi]|uniref:Uncharacterized protein n=1 Tax=Puccinia sorghi TaxID=27349 RepID=A0A0L6V0L2_9BASI|nr:hypothetical protein VP01_3066g2 [Puccinia sorghi]KNZ61794.1 hypothetical protein VP01_1356g1 [Puccinia sorghi]
MSGVAPKKRPRPFSNSQSDWGNDIEPALHSRITGQHSKSTLHQTDCLSAQVHIVTASFSIIQYQCVGSVLFLSHYLNSFFLLLCSVLPLSPLVSFNCSATSVKSFISYVIFFLARRFCIIFPEPLPLAHSYSVINWENFGLNHAHESSFLFLVLAHLVVLEPCVVAIIFDSKSVSPELFFQNYYLIDSEYSSFSFLTTTFSPARIDLRHGKKKLYIEKHLRINLETKLRMESRMGNSTWIPNQGYRQAGNLCDMGNTQPHELRETDPDHNLTESTQYKSELTPLNICDLVSLFYLAYLVCTEFLQVLSILSGLNSSASLSCFIPYPLFLLTTFQPLVQAINPIGSLPSFYASP